MKVLITTVQIPFITGGAEILASTLKTACQRAGHETEIVTIPYRNYPPTKMLDHLFAASSMDLEEVCGQKIDRVIGLKFPAYAIPHPRKSLWLLHQQREVYDLWHTPLSDIRHHPDGLAVRKAICEADTQIISECQPITTISKNVSKRLMHYNQLPSQALYPPPQDADKFTCAAEAEDFIFFPSRMNSIKRQELVLAALARTKSPVRVVFAGQPDIDSFWQHIKQMVKNFKLEDRVEFLGPIPQDLKLSLYSRCLAVIYPPLDEDYGYVTLEGMLASKPIITCTDSGGPLEFVENDKTGYVRASTPESLATALDEAWNNRTWASQMGQAARALYHDLDIGWEKVLGALLP